MKQQINMLFDNLETLIKRDMQFVDNIFKDLAPRPFDQITDEFGLTIWDNQTMLCIFSDKIVLGQNFPAFNDHYAVIKNDSKLLNDFNDIVEPVSQSLYLSGNVHRPDALAGLDHMVSVAIELEMFKDSEGDRKGFTIFNRLSHTLDRDNIESIIPEIKALVKVSNFNLISLFAATEHVLNGPGAIPFTLTH